MTCNERGVLSLYSDCTEWAGTPEALTLRRADTWNLETGYPITASECFRRGTRVRALCLAAAREQCRRQQESSLAVYHPDFSRRLRRNLNLRNFYLSEKGFHFFYQPWAIAPGFEGCPPSCCPFPTAKPMQPARSGPQITLAMRKKVLYNQSVIVRDRAERAKPRAGRN